MDKLTIQTETTVLKINTQSIVVSPVNSVNGKTGVVVLSAEDVGQIRLDLLKQYKNRLMLLVLKLSKKQVLMI
jgi:hypothetical protein